MSGYSADESLYLPDGRYPLDGTRRQAIRDGMREAYLAQAEERIARGGRTGSCGGYPLGVVRHAGDPLGCPFPYSCICECHDQGLLGLPMDRS